MDVRKVISDNLPVILTSMALTGVASTAIMAVRATPEALRDIWDAQSERTDDLTKLEVVRLTYHHYIPAFLVGGLTVAAIISAQTISTKRQAAIVGLYSLTDRAFTEYREKVVQEIGKKKDRAISDEIAQEKVDASPAKLSEIIITGAGNHLCHDSITGRYFESNIEKIKAAQNEINATCINEMYASQNDFYKKIGLPITPYGEEIGWRVDNMMDIRFTSVLEPETQRPCLSLEYRLDPIRGYYKGH